MISKEYVEKFKRLYKEEFGEDISDKEAYDKFLRLVNLLRIILRPIPKKIEQIGLVENRSKGFLGK